MLLSGRISKAFKESNKSGDGVLDYDDMRLAISKAQGHEIDPGDFNDAVAEYDPFETHEITHATFTAIYLKVDKDEMQDVRATDRAKVCSLMVIGWLALGMFFFAAAEGWSNVESMYFGVVTLTTIGFGDYFPNTPRGVGFHFLFCIFGLGLVATLLGALSALAAGGGGDDEEEEEGKDKDSTDGDGDEKPAKNKGGPAKKKGGDADEADEDEARPLPKKAAQRAVAADEPAPRRRQQRHSNVMNPPPTGLAGQAMMQEGSRHQQHQQPVRRPMRRAAPPAAPAPVAPPPPAQQAGMFGLPGIPGLDPAALFAWVPGQQQQQQQVPQPVAPAPQASRQTTGRSDRPVQRRPVQRRPAVEEEDAEGDEEAPPPRPAPRRKPRPIPADEL
jgi:hypothetical protein